MSLPVDYAEEGYVRSNRKKTHTTKHWDRECGISGVIKDEEEGQCGRKGFDDNFRMLIECKILFGLCKDFLFYSEINGEMLCSLKQRINMCWR